MAPHRRPGGPDDPSRGEDGWLGPLLKAEADRYEPDRDRIQRRVRAGIEKGAPHRAAQVRPFRRSGWLLPAAAAASFVALIAGAITVMQQYSDGESPRSVEVATQTSAQPSSGSTGSSRPSPQLGSAVSSGPSTSSATASRHPSSAKASVQLTRTPVATGKAVTLPGNAVDWIVAGSRADTETERSLSGGQQISGPHLTGNPAASSAPGPFITSWSGGMPDQSRLGSTTWLTVTGPVGGPETGLLLKVPARKQAATLIVYVGASAADGNLTARLASQGAVAQTRLKAGPKGSGYVVTIHFRTSGPADTLEMRLISGSGGSIALAAAVLQ